MNRYRWRSHRGHTRAGPPILAGTGRWICAKVAENNVDENTRLPENVNMPPPSPSPLFRNLAPPLTVTQSRVTS